MPTVISLVRVCKLVLCLTALLVIGPMISRADSPEWADQQMLLAWPESLGDTVPVVTLQPSEAAGRVTITDFGVDDDNVAVNSADFWEPPSESENPSRSVTPTGAARYSQLRHRQALCDCGDDWQILPAGVLYKSYIAGEKEPRMAAALLSEKDRGAVVETAIGGRLGFVRYGSQGDINPEGFQWDLEGAAFLRQDPEQELDVEATDFRIGTVATWRRGATAVKGGYYHLSSHLGDEFLIRNIGFPRLNYVRDSVLIGVRHNIRDDVSVYGEVAYAFKTDGGAEPLELQFGLEYSPVGAGDDNSAPFAAINAHLREEFGFGGSMNILAGWEWRGTHSDRRLRIGGQYYTGKEIQWSFFDESVTFAGVGIWYDF